jgi:leader peptidase (prepilin peptidase) / N-methyltransferase
VRALLIALLAVGGLAIGPVLRFLIVWLSVPAGEPWRQACPACAAPLRLTASAGPPALRPGGRCAGCRVRLGPPPFSVEVTAGALLALLGAAVHPALVLVAACWLALCAIPLGYVDAVTQRLPDRLTGPAYLGTAVFLLSAAAAGGSWARLGRGLLGGVAFAGFCLVLLLVSRSALGPGDVKLAASLGTALAWFGWLALFEGALAGFVLGAGYGVALLVGGHAGRKSRFPFGPFMIAGAFLIMLVTSWP